MLRKRSVALFLYTKNRSYESLLTLASAIHKGISDMPLVYNPTQPTLLQFADDIALLKQRINAWGTRGTHGSKSDLAYLKASVEIVRDDLRMLADFVMMKTPNSVENWTKAGFSVKSIPSPTGMLEAVMNLHMVISPKVSPYEVQLKWKRPGNGKGLKGLKYRVLYGETEDFEQAKHIGVAGKAFFKHTTPSIKGGFYCIIPINSDGSDGVPSHFCFAAPRIVAPVKD